MTRLRVKGHFGDFSPIVNHSNLFEIKLNEFRIYFTKRDDLIILLLGGIKNNQIRDIERAWKLMKENYDD